MNRDTLLFQDVGEFIEFARWQEWGTAAPDGEEILHLVKYDRHERIYHRPGDKFTYFRHGLFPLVFAFTSRIAEEVFEEWRKKHGK